MTQMVDHLPRPRLRAAALATAAAALVALTTGACGGPSDCCVKAPTASPSPTSPGGVPGAAWAYPSQAMSLRVRAGTDFDIVLRPGAGAGPEAGKGSGGGSRWQVNAPKIEGIAVRHRTGSAAPDEKGGVRATFHAVKPGTARVVLTEAGSDRTMTYQVTVVTGPGAAPSAAPSATGGGLDRGRTLDAGFAGGPGGEVTVRRGERFSLPNAYSNVPGITWRVVSRSSSGPVPLLSDTPHVEGNAAGDRKDWYTFSADQVGTTEVKLFGCYRCADGSTPETAESRAHSETRSVRITVR
ncbi:hypothetical protein [Streptomyces sp. NPDC052496]|uniref:hypothetical protein n=1 Tax=Streptomyces sp. NPDC052496 TaxID=3154951 RepID=UPI00341F783C